MKKGEKKQTFYEKVLSKTIGEPLESDYVYTRDSLGNRYYVDPMGQTQYLQLGSTQLPPSGRNDIHLK